jgi:hypothetical protein
VNDLEADVGQALWCSALRRQATEYMARTGVHHGEIGEVSAWAVFPHISEAIAERWGKVAVAMMNGEQHPDFVVGNPAEARELAPMLAARAEVLRLAALDDSVWDD